MKQFDKNADAYQAIRNKIAYPDSLYKRLILNCPSHNAALDIGCGNGVSTVRLKPYFGYVEGQDIGAALIEKAEKTFPGITFKVCSSEELSSERKFDLVTSATSFYWMDRDLVLGRIVDILSDGGVFCAYKYEFPVVYGRIRNIIERELALKWSRFRDSRLTNYDDTLERINASNRYKDAERFLISNIIILTPEQLALFFLSTSYVTRFIEEEGGPKYAEKFLKEVCEAEKNATVHVNFDIHGFMARKRQ